MTAYQKILSIVPTLYSANIASKSYAQLKKKKKNIVKQGTETIVGVSLAKEVNDFVNAV